MRARDFIKLSELNMSPSRLEKSARTINGLLVGIEFELIIPHDKSVMERAYSNIRLTSIADLVKFFSKLEANTPTDIEVGLTNLLNVAEEYVSSDSSLLAHAVEMFPDNSSEDMSVEDFVRSKHFNFELFLEDSGLTSVFDIADEIFLKVPDPAYNAVSTSISKLLGKPSKASMMHNSPTKKYDTYNVEPDPSITVTEGQLGVEIVSPPQPLEETLKDLDKIVQWAHNIHATTNSSTGLHINISVPGYNVNTLDYTKLVLFSGDNYILSQFDRSMNSFAVSAQTLIDQAAERQMDWDPTEVLGKMKKSLMLAARGIFAKNFDKHVSVNANPTHVEIRSPGGDWLGQYNSLIRSTIMRYATALNIAVDPMAEKQEYAKKLYKLLMKNFDPREFKIMDKFAEYAAGNINKYDLKFYLYAVNQIRQRRGG